MFVFRNLSYIIAIWCYMRHNKFQDTRNTINSCIAQGWIPCLRRLSLDWYIKALMVRSLWGRFILLFHVLSYIAHPKKVAAKQATWNCGANIICTIKEKRFYSIFFEGEGTRLCPPVMFFDSYTQLTNSIYLPQTIVKLEICSPTSLSRG